MSNETAIHRNVGAAFFVFGVVCGWRTPEVAAIELEARAHPDAITLPPDEVTAERMTGR